LHLTLDSPLDLYSANLDVNLVVCDEIWIVGLRPISCATRCVCWRAILLEDKSGGQLAILFALKG